MSHIKKKYTSYKYSHYFSTDLPQHWQTKRLGYISAEYKTAFVDGPFGSDLKTSDYKDVGIPLIQLNNIRDGKHLLQNMKFINETKKQELIRHIAKPGDIVIAKMAEPVARSTLVSSTYDEYVIVADCIKLTPNMKLVNLDYLVWVINSDEVRINAELVSTGTTRIRISLSELKKLKVPFPPLPEQIKIANFLDYETARIDRLIEKQQQLIGLLKEKRQAVISHAVTKGLNPDVPMKESGVEWLGKVPEHWNVSRVKNTVTTIIDGPHFSPNYQDSGYMFISARNIKTDQWALEDAKFISENDFLEFSKRVLPEKGDVLLTKGGTTGIARAVDLDFAFQVWVHIAVLKVIPNKVSPFFLAFALNGKACYEQSQLYTYGATNNDLSLGRIANIYCTIPPKSEQEKLVLYLEERCNIFDKLIQKSEKAINLLKERRTALISAAVTGKIDVRDWQRPKQNQTGKEENL